MIKDFVTHAERRFSTRVKMIRTDNAIELTEWLALKFYQECGIELQTSCRATPQQYKVVERKHKPLVEIVRTLSFQSNLPKHFWGDCIQTTTYLINRMPLKSLLGLLPYEKLFIGIRPYYAKLRSFGCLCFVSTLKRDRTKFDHRAEPHVFIGYLVQTS